MKIPAESFQFEIVLDKEEKRAKILAPDYYKHFIKTKTKVGEKGTMHLDFKKPTRSKVQLNYYFVIVGLIAVHTGDTKEEMHDVLTSLKFGTKKLNRFGREVEVRRSVSDVARMNKTDMGELIEFALEKAAYLNVNVPTAESLGYIRN